MSGSDDPLFVRIAYIYFFSTIKKEGETPVSPGDAMCICSFGSLTRRGVPAWLQMKRLF
jgi:hypothetical protein